jgi:cytochrome P450
MTETGIYGQDANEFDPHRWLNSETLSSLKLPHLSYGAGARNCPAWQLSNHILYGLLIRLIVSFDFRVHESARPVTHWTTFVGNGGFVVSPKDYLMYFVPRDGVTL